MKNRHVKRNIVLLALLAALCIGAAELAACSHFAPDVYHQITDPVYHAAAVTADACRSGLRAAGQFCLDTGRRAAQLLSDTADRAVLLWEALTTPEEIVPEDDPQYDDPPSESSPPPTFAPPVDPPLTELVERDGRQVLTGGTVDVTYFYQAGEDWADQPYGTDTIGLYGCGPTVMAMAVASMTDSDTDPAAMAAWAVEHGYWARRSGSYHSIVLGIARDFGLRAETFPSRDLDDMRRTLMDGGILVALVGPGHFTKGGHFILIRGTTLSGDVLVADPNSPERSLMVWDPQLILDELSSARDHGAPLWVLSAPDT